MLWILHTQYVELRQLTRTLRVGDLSTSPSLLVLRKIIVYMLRVTRLVKSILIIRTTILIQKQVVIKRWVHQEQKTLWNVSPDIMKRSMVNILLNDTYMTIFGKLWW